MKSSRLSRSLLAVAVATVALTACGASAPPASELADEMIDTLDVSDDVKDCMHKAVVDFQLTEEEAQGFDDLDEVADKAADGQAQAIQIMDRFEAELSACNPAG